MIEKSLYQAPLGESTGMDELEIITEPNVTPHEDGSVTVDLSGDDLEDALPDEASQVHSANLAMFMKEEDLTTLGSELFYEVEEDRRSRADWEDTFKDGLKLLGLKIETRTEPWEGACGVVHPMMTEAVV